MHTVPGGDDGRSTLEQNFEAMRVIGEFLEEHGIVSAMRTTTSNE